MVDEIGRGLYDGAEVGAGAVRGTRTVHVKSHVAHPEHPIEGELDTGNDADEEHEAKEYELALVLELGRHELAVLLEPRGDGLHELLELVDLNGQLVHVRRHFRHFGTKAVGGRGSGHGGQEALPLDLSDNAFGEFVLEISHRTLSR